MLVRINSSSSNSNC